MVVDLAVVDDPDALVLVRHRLSTARDVDDRQAAVSEADRPVDPEPLTVRSPMAQHVPHALQTRLVDGLSWIQIDDANDPAHGRLHELTLIEARPSSKRTCSRVSSKVRPAGAEFSSSRSDTRGGGAETSSTGRSSVTIRSGKRVTVE